MEFQWDFTPGPPPEKAQGGEGDPGDNPANPDAVQDDHLKNTMYDRIAGSDHESSQYVQKFFFSPFFFIYRSLKITFKNKQKQRVKQRGMVRKPQGAFTKTTQSPSQGKKRSRRPPRGLMISLHVHSPSSSNNPFVLRIRQ